MPSRRGGPPRGRRPPRPHSSGRGACGALGPGPPAWAGGPFPSVGSAAPVLAGLGPSGRMRLAGAGAPAAPVPFQALWGPPAGESAAKPVKCPRRGAGALYARSGEGGGAARRLPTAVRARPIIPSAVPMAGPADGPVTAAPFAPRARLGPGRGPRARHARFLLRAALGLRCPSGPIPIARRRPAPDGFARRVHGRGPRMCRNRGGRERRPRGAPGMAIYLLAARRGSDRRRVP